MFIGLFSMFTNQPIVKFMDFDILSLNFPCVETKASINFTDGSSFENVYILENAI